MANTIRWTDPTNSAVGSVLIYRSANSVSESLGSRSIIATVGAKTSNGSWLGSYIDSTGDSNSLYRIQFWDGTGSSTLSDVIGDEYSELLANYNDVIRVARLQNQDVGSEQVYYAIRDASDNIFWEAGDPIKRSVVYIDSETGVNGRVYDITGHFGPIYQVREVFVDDPDTQIVSNADFDVDYPQGNIRFSNTFLGSYQGKYVWVNWVPQTYHLLVKYMAALDLVEGEMLYSGTTIENPNVMRLKRKIDEIKDTIRPKGVFSTNTTDILNSSDYIAQPLDRTHIFFNK